MNTRMVNYTIDSKGCYHMRAEDGHVRTKNGFTYLSPSYYPLEDVTLMSEEPDRVYPSNIEGLEDVRLFGFKDKLYFTASTKNLADDGNIHIALGGYNIEDAKMHNISLIKPPRPSGCEKNWIPLGDNRVI